MDQLSTIIKDWRDLNKRTQEEHKSNMDQIKQMGKEIALSIIREDGIQLGDIFAMMDRGRKVHFMIQSVALSSFDLFGEEMGLDETGKARLSRLQAVEIFLAPVKLDGNKNWVRGKSAGFWKNMIYLNFDEKDGHVDWYTKWGEKSPENPVS